MLQKARIDDYYTTQGKTTKNNLFIILHYISFYLFISLSCFAFLKAYVFVIEILFIIFSFFDKLNCFLL